jgi:RNA polymerase sigma-70 factor (ECF subfamily)
MRTDHDPLPPVWDWTSARERCLKEARRYTHERADAEDVVQEALLRAWKTRTSLRNTGHPMPWLLQITRNEAIRSLARSGRDQERAVLVAEPEPEPIPDEWTERAAIRLDVEAAMRHLGEDDREMVNLRYTEELTHSNIADLMNIPVGTCKVRLHRLRKRLGALLREEVPA